MKQNTHFTEKSTKTFAEVSPSNNNFSSTTLNLSTTRTPTHVETLRRSGLTSLSAIFQQWAFFVTFFCNCADGSFTTPTQKQFHSSVFIPVESVKTKTELSVRIVFLELSPALHHSFDRVHAECGAPRSQRTATRARGGGESHEMKYTAKSRQTPLPKSPAGSGQGQSWNLGRRSGCSGTSWSTSSTLHPWTAGRTT